MHAIKISAYDIDATPPDLLDDIVRLHLHLDQELRQDDPPRLAADPRGFLAGGWGAPGSGCAGIVRGGSGRTAIAAA